MNQLNLLKNTCNKVNLNSLKGNKTIRESSKKFQKKKFITKSLNLTIKDSVFINFKKIGNAKKQKKVQKDI